MKLSTAVSDFVSSKQAQGLSPRSVDQYSGVLRLFEQWCATNGIAATEQLDQRVIDRWQAHVLSDVSLRTHKALSRASARTYVRVTGIFLRWCQADDLVGPKVKAKQPKKEKKLLRVLTREEIDKLEAVADSERDKVVVRTLADSGVRLSELLNLRASDLILSGRQHFLRVDGKSGPRQVPVSPGLFIRLRRLAHRGGDQLFMTNRASHKTGQVEPLRPRSLQNMLVALGQRADVEGVHAHAFRHAFITRALRSGMNVVVLKDIVGHSDLSQISNTYSHLLPGDHYEALLRMLSSESSSGK